MTDAEDVPGWRRAGRWARPALARGAAWGASLALVVVAPSAYLIGAAATPRDLAAFVAVCAAAGVLGGAPSVWLEAQARPRGGHARCGLALLAGAAAALGWVVAVPQAVYLTGALQGGVERGLTDVARFLADFAGEPNQVAGVSLGSLVSLSCPLALLVLVRAHGAGRGAQAATGCVWGCAGPALMLVALALAALLVGLEGDLVERAMDLPGLGVVVTAAFVASLLLVCLSAPLSLVATLALAVADRTAPSPPAVPAGAEVGT